jgi:formylglycine-generating enzyme required for sulfatase activity
MCWIPPGEFLMGSPADERQRNKNEIQHRVIITHGFFLAKTQITQAQWRSVMGNNPSHFTKNGDEGPTEGVSWLDVCGCEGENEGFLERINRLTTTDGRFHLPTEAQWEYACRAGTTGPYYSNLDDVAWYRNNSAGATHPVGQKQPNNWGLHDMLGNVWEWCSDWYEEYSTEGVANCADPLLEPYRVYRGGGCNNSSFNCRAATRNNYIPTNNNYVGFRIARSTVR